MYEDRMCDEDFNVESSAEFLEGLSGEELDFLYYGSGMKICPNCGGKLKREAAQYHWRGVIMHGWVCTPCFALWDIGGAFIRYVEKVAKRSKDKKRDPDRR